MKKLKLVLLFFTVFQLNAQVPNFPLAGFATEGGGTTGGEGGAEVTVTTFEDLKKFAETVDTKYIIYVKGRITGSGSVTGGDYVGRINVKSNKTIIGLSPLQNEFQQAFLDGVGFTISGVKNVIIKNIKFSFVSIGKAIPVGSSDIANIYSAKGDEGRPQILVNSGDLISIAGVTSNIWIDHCEFFQEDPKTQTNIDLYDGLIDIKNTSQNITLSWNYFHDHHKCHLIGSSDGDIFADRKITFHHNFYERIGSRVPLYRGGTGHFFNNLCLSVTGGSVNTRMEACVRVEKNHWENSKNTVYSRDSKIAGKAEILDNKEVSVTNTYAAPATCTAVIPYNYAAVLTEVNGVKDLVTKYAGVGKIILGLEDDLEESNMVSSINCFPNPSSGNSTISFQIQKRAQVDLSIYDGLGNKVKTILNGEISEGPYEFLINTSEMKNGMYTCTFTINNKVTSEKLIVANK